ncbi:MAG: hypothetical protein M0Q53_17635 [Prolixibacteraceae bacterium]|jgi:hypothetical protein|nr:hypothetical protein [Prolixibacteraceae bacterium]
METTNENLNVPKQRHGCVTAWLILMIVANSLSAGLYLFAKEMVTKSLPGEVSTPMIILLGILAIGNIIFSVMLFQWKKLGFWGFVVTGAGALIINLIIGLGVGQSLFGLAGIAILYGVLQIKQGNVTAWENLD